MIGIYVGLYCKISIVLLYLFFYLIYLIFSRKKRRKQFKLFSYKRYFRYIKILFPKPVIKIIIIFSVIANTVVLFQNKQYENLYKNLNEQNCEFTGIVVLKEENQCKVKITTEKYQNTYLSVYLNEDITIEYGDKIIFNGIFSSPEKRSNYKGFDYAEYLKTQKIYGTIKAEKVEVIAKNKGDVMIKYTDKLSNKMKERIEDFNLSKEEKAMLKGILLGDTLDISEEVLNQFSASSILHILSVSGMHISYIIIASNFIFNQWFGKHDSKIVTSLVILIYMAMVNFTPSVVRAGITGIVFTLSNFFYRKNDVWQSLGLALFVILLYNPFLIQDVGLELSFAGTLGIIVFQKNFQKWIMDFLDRKNRQAIRKNKKITKMMIKGMSSKLGKSILDAILVTISATLGIMPILLITFHMVNVTSLIISVLTSFLVGPIMILGLIVIVVKINLFEEILSLFLKWLINMAKWGSNLPLNQIYFITPSIWKVILYYTTIIILNFILKINLEKNPTMFQKRIKNLINFAKYKLKSNKKKFIALILMISLLYGFISIIPKNLKIYFVDVGQGDCSLILTPKNQSILIDGGGSEWSDFDVRRKNINALFIK